MLSSVGVPFCYRTLFKWIGKLTKWTIYDFRHVHIKSKKKRYFIAMQNVISAFVPPIRVWSKLSHYFKLVFMVFKRYLKFNVTGVSENSHFKKKNRTKTYKHQTGRPWRLYYYTFSCSIHFYTSCRKYKPTKQLLINFFSTSVSNTLSPLKYIRNFV